MAALLCFTMDNLGDAADLGRGLIERPRPPGLRPALERGFPAMLELYERHGVRVTHFVEGWNGEAHAREVRELVERGHTVGMHGWQHERWAGLDAARARELAARATEALQGAAGARPRSFRAPGGDRGAFTPDILRELGYTLDASRPEPGEAAAIRLLAPGLWTVPYAWELVDATHWLWEQRSCAEVEERWRRALEQAAREEGALVFVWHPHVMGLDEARLRVGANILAEARGDPRFELVGLEELAARRAASPAS